MSRESVVMQYYQTMLEQLGPSGWWPAESSFEVAVGAVLTQNTNWKNVEKALERLKHAAVLKPQALAALCDDEIAELIRPAGFFNIKARRLRALLVWLEDICQYDMSALQEHSLPELRESLLNVKGVGPETADSILLYGVQHPTFVVDAYTRRIFSRHGLVPEDICYEELRDFFMDVLPHDVSLYNEYHALIVRIGKEWCKPTPRCSSCPLNCLLSPEIC